MSLRGVPLLSPIASLGNGGDSQKLTGRALKWTHLAAPNCNFGDPFVTVVIVYVLCPDPPSHKENGLVTTNG